jgi:hypothetical protein
MLRVERADALGGYEVHGEMSLADSDGGEGQLAELPHVAHAEPTGRALAADYLDLEQRMAPG